MVLLLQKEVVERICAKPGDMSLLAVSIQFYAEVENLFNVQRHNFYPIPEVDSAVVRIKSRFGEDQNEKKVDEKEFFRLVHFGFSAKRKMLKNNLAGGLKISAKEIEAKLVKLGVGAKVRAEDLSVEDWKRLLPVIF
jgi:16S rRNA (adenine1518-N6/adenine1519-N6)-dimethyltransferase